MRDFGLKVLHETNQFVIRMDTTDWTLVFMVVVGFGVFCMRGVGKKSNI